MFGSKVRKLKNAGDVAALMELLSSSEARERADAANALSDPTLVATHRDECINLLRRAASDVDEGVRGQAIFALLELGASDVSDLCLGALNDGDGMVRLIAATGSGRLHDRRAVPRLLELMVDGDPLVRQNVYWSLAEIGDVSVLPAMQERLHREHDREAKEALKESIEGLTPA